MPLDDIYSASYVSTLFNQMAGSYDRVNYLSSFGFSERWRTACINKARPEANDAIVDLMTGIGDAWPHLLRVQNELRQLIAVDFSEGMLRHATQRLQQHTRVPIHLLKEDALQTSIEASWADRVFCLFGLKTLNAADLHRLALEIRRILKPGGQFSLIEVSVPRNSLLRRAYLFYLKLGIPLLGRLLLGNPENYRMLGVYTERFGNCKSAAAVFREAGLQVEYHEYFFGCATGISGSKERAG